MAHTLIDHIGNSTSPSVTGTVGAAVIGPPSHGGMKQQSLYVWQSGTGTSKTLRWLEDVNITGASPTTYSAV